MKPPLNGGRLVKIRLSDVPVAVRRRHGAYLLASATADADLMLAVDYKRAIEHPSDREYLLPENAVRAVLS